MVNAEIDFYKIVAKKKKEKKKDCNEQRVSKGLWRVEVCKIVRNRREA